MNDSAPGAQVLPRVVEAAAFRWHSSSVNTTYVRLVAAGSQTTERIADQMRRDFRIPEKRAAYLRLIGLALSSNTASAWAEIERMAFSKRPAVPLDIIVKVYADAGRQNEAADIIAKLPLEQKIRSLVMIGKSHEAINIATQERSDRLLYLIQRLLHKTDRPAADQVGRIRQQLSLNSPSS
ncbi:unnamed protein product [Mesocestoides corti]|uniref:Vps16 C-terminal domain-containing protein n=1 Tax=Mesocestoides corti TaxID=53468 RepID=A0A3P6H964_MESCO|nr:unnamed protein product [Mesocestoides corti]